MFFTIPFWTTSQQTTSAPPPSGTPVLLTGNSNVYNNAFPKYSPYTNTGISGTTGALSGMTLYIEPSEANELGTRIYVNAALGHGYGNLYNLIDTRFTTEYTGWWSNNSVGSASLVFFFPTAKTITSVKHITRAYPNFNEQSLQSITYWDGNSYVSTGLSVNPSLPDTPSTTQGFENIYRILAITEVGTPAPSSNYWKLNYNLYGAIGELEIEGY